MQDIVWDVLRKVLNLLVTCGFSLRQHKSLQHWSMLYRIILNVFSAASCAPSRLLALLGERCPDKSDVMQHPNDSAVMWNPAKQQHTYEKQNEHQNPQCSLAHNLKLPPRDLEFIQHQRNQLICFKSPAKRTRTSNQCRSSWPAHNDYAKHEQCVQICLAVADRQSPCCCSNTTTTMFARRCLRNLETNDRIKANSG